MQQRITFVLIGVKRVVQVTTRQRDIRNSMPTTAAALSSGVSAGAVGVGLVTEFDGC